MPCGSGRAREGRTGRFRPHPTPSGWHGWSRRRWIPHLRLSVNEGIIACQLFSRLVEHTPELGIVPDVAESWEVSGGGRQYMFHLRDDVCLERRRAGDGARL